MKKPSIKTIAIMIVLIGLLVSPDVMFDLKAKLLHGIAIILHMVYEIESFLLEEWLIHSFELNKATAQMLTFYFNCMVGAGMAYRFWRRLPRMLHRWRHRCHCFFEQSKLNIRFAWESMPNRQKIQWVATQLVVLTGGFFWLMA
ncbi:MULTISPECIES: hypothetical protein [Methylomonas]|uniref:hypothetical protein n=1 Tax=Methylomonas TaxID=416 RepID=UPI001232CF02|nr:hypothetical protein [Methylomonas rhizoryzae]